MALLESIRQKKVFLFVVIGVAMLMFVIGDLNWQSLFGQSPTEVAKIEGEELDYMDYERRVAEMTAFYEVQYGSDAQMQEQVRSQVWNAFVYETLVGRQCEKLGLQVSDEELTSRLTGDNPHPALAQMRLFYNPDKGGFDPDLLQNMLGIISDYENNGNAQYNAEYVEKLKNCWGFVEHYIRTALLQEKYQALVSTSFTVNDLELKKFYNDRQTCDFRYVMQPYYQLPDSMFQYTDKELMTRYKQESQNFLQPNETRTIEVLTFAIAPSGADFELVKNDIEALKDEFAVTEEYESFVNMNSDQPYSGVAVSEADVDADLKDFAFSASTGDLLPPTLFNRTYKMARVVETGIMEPDSIQFEHILVYENSPERTEAVADSLMGLLKGGADFGLLARGFSKAQSAQSGGQLGWMKLADGLDAGLLAAAKKNADNVPFLLDLGGTKQIFRVTGRTKPVKKVKLAVVTREVSHSNTTYSTIYSKASQYIAANRNQDSFEAAAVADSGYFLRAYTLTSEDYRVGDINDARALVRWACKAKQGDVTEEVYECGDKFVIACLKSISEKGVKPFDEVKDQVRVMVLNDKKAEQIKADMEAKLAGGSDLAALGQVQVSNGASTGNSYVPNIGNEPKLAGSLSKLATDKVLVQAGNAGVYALQLLTKNEPTAEFDTINEMNQYVGRNPYAYMVFDALKESAEIKDNRINFQ